MSICKDCIHNGVCKYGENRSNGMYCTGDKCKQYKSAEDVAEVVLCKYCVLRDTEGCPFMYWDESGDLMGDTKDNDFCSCGERKEQ